MPSAVSRRDFLRGSAVLAGGAALPGRAASAGQLRGGEILPDPDFSLLRENNPYVIGVRPHRKGGVRLELADAPIETPAGKKYVIHDYGHGGAGITLSWGCASIVVELAEQALAKLATSKQTARVAVLGTGVAGLTAATELRRRWPSLPLAVYAQDLDVRTTTSFIAGGQFEPSGIFHEYEGEERKKLFGSYLRRSRDRIVELQRSPQRLLFGVAERKDYTLDHENRALDVFTPADVIGPYRKGALPFEKLRTIGREYDTWLMNPTVLLPKLRGDLEGAGVPFRQRQFGGLEDVAALEENLIVNCTGLGSKKLFSDDNLVPQRGHLVILKKTDPKQFYFFSGGCTNPVICYVFCRQDDIVIGGTVQSGNDSRAHDAADDAVFQRLLDNAQQVFGGHPAACLS